MMMPFVACCLNKVNCVLKLKSRTRPCRKLLLLIFITILASQLMIVVNSARIQTFTIYSELDGKGDSESYVNNIQDLYNASVLVAEGRVKWKCIERGIWLEYSGINYNFKNRNTNQFSNILHGFNGKCFSPTQTVQSIRHIGHSDLELPGISLYKRENFNGEELYFDGTTLQLPVAITFQSFGFTGTEPWTLYSGTDFTGESNICLQPQRIDEMIRKQDILDSQLIFHTNVLPTPFIVGSIRRGCGHHNGHGHGGVNVHPQRNKIKRLPPSLNLYSQLIGKHHSLYMDGDEMKLPGTGHTFIAYEITGISNWTIYSGNEFNGIAKCLVSSDTGEDDHQTQQQQQQQHSHYGGLVIHNTTIEEDKHFQVGSIKRGCESDGKSTAICNYKHLFFMGSNIRLSLLVALMAIIIRMTILH